MATNNKFAAFNVLNTNFCEETDHIGMYKMKFLMTDARAIAPFRGSGDAAGLDIAPFCDGIVQPEQVVLVNTGLAVEMPSGHYGRIAARSSVLMRGITISGDIDYDYRGEIKLIVNINNSPPHCYTLYCAGSSIFKRITTDRTRKKWVWIDNKQCQIRC